MPIVEPDYVHVVLDPAEVADAGRVQLFLNDGPIIIAGEGIDWGDAAIQAYMSDQQIGSSPVDYRLPNRTVTIPLVLGGNNNPSLFAASRAALQQKVALFQREGGWIKRGDVGLYADVVNATLTKPDRYGEQGSIEPDVKLVLECLPDFYGDEITLDTITATGYAATPLTLAGVTAVIKGDHPGRCRLVFTDTSAHRQRGLIWGLRSRHYDSASTAALAYDAAAMTPINGAVTAGSAGTYSGNVLAVVPQANTWHPWLVTDLVSGGQQLTHQGSYGVWARCTTDLAGMQLRLAWSLDDTTSPEFNDPVVMPVAGYGTVWTLEHLGNIRVDAPPVGAHWWRGVLQAYAGNTSAAHVAVDKVWLVPLDESSGFAYASQTPPAFALSNFLSPTVGGDDASVGTVAWSSTSNISIEDNKYATVSVPAGGQSHHLTAEGYGFAVPGGATITGVLMQIGYQAKDPTGFTAPGGLVVRLIKAGVVQGASAPGSFTPGTFGSDQVAIYGGADDLWGLTLTAADVNAAGFGAAASWINQGASTEGVSINVIYLQVFYTTSGGFTPTPDAVINASRIAEVRTEGVWREDTTSTAFVEVAGVQGDNPRIPPSGMENRPVELIAKPSRGDLQSRSDAAIDGFTAQPIYRPSYLFPA